MERKYEGDGLLAGATFQRRQWWPLGRRQSHILAVITFLYLNLYVRCFLYEIAQNYHLFVIGVVPTPQNEHRPPLVTSHLLQTPTTKPGT